MSVQHVMMITLHSQNRRLIVVATTSKAQPLRGISLESVNADVRRTGPQSWWVHSTHSGLSPGSEHA